MSNQPAPQAGGWEATATAPLDPTCLTESDRVRYTYETYPHPIDPVSRSSYLDGDRFNIDVEQVPAPTKDGQ